MSHLHQLSPSLYTGFSGQAIRVGAQAVSPGCSVPCLALNRCICFFLGPLSPCLAVQGFIPQDDIMRARLHTPGPCKNIWEGLTKQAVDMTLVTWKVLNMAHNLAPYLSGSFLRGVWLEPAFS